MFRLPSVKIEIPYFKSWVTGALAGAVAGVTVVGGIFACLNDVDISESVKNDKGEVIVDIPMGTAGVQIPALLEKNGIDVNAFFFKVALRLTGADRNFHAGYYSFSDKDTVFSMARRIADGDVVILSWRLSDGATQWELRRSLNEMDGVKHDSAQMSADEILLAIGATESHLEGLFAPDTYKFKAGVSDLKVLKKAYDRQKTILGIEWDARSPDCVVKTPYEALILASIIEREVGRPQDRLIVSGIFSNRLRVKMPLQTDPSVMYGEGEEFEGRLRKKHLNRRTPYNTYRFVGLPPTPIGNPTRESIYAALHPAKTDYIYFINKDNGDLVPNKTLEEHNKAVDLYIRKKGQ